MKRFLIALCALVFACGAPAADTERLTPPEISSLDSEVAVPVDMGPEFASAAQPTLTTTDFYGQDPSSNACTTDGGTHGWAGGKCYFPALKTYHIYVDTSQCTGNLASDYVAAINAAVSYVRGVVNSQGWTEIANVDRTHPGQAISMGCGSVFSGSSSTAVGGTSTGLIGPLDCESKTFGQACFYANPVSRLYNSRIDHIFVSGTTQTQRRTYMNAVATHELGHAFGFGHESCNDGSGRSWVMDPIACEPPLNQPSNFVLSGFTSFDLNALQTYHR